ncbi:calmodulin-binding protein 60 B-like [Eucalyptus grandis]|uniref:calmodulin-binding protein 60 B-like n=1 Tax=Eucalyptus grandis TaxID=71139 RepID=UPI00192EE117|nr:calmodulin-binding protein 60 B-like [Eucalyptus grandis]
MSMRKRALAFGSSDQPSQPKRPCVAPIEQELNGSERKLKPRSCLIEEDGWSELREELEPAKSHSAKDCRRANGESTAKNDARNLQLQFQTKLSLPVFTGEKLEGEGGASISVALVDANTGQVVTLGLESSIKLDVVVLEGDFNKYDEDNWAQEEFENYIVKEREGKGPLLTGNLVVTLEQGLGELGKLIFNDDSSWTRSKSFRIGLKVTLGCCGNTRIREAKTDAFPVKEYKREAHRRHYPLACNHGVRRLEKIAKDGKSHRKRSLLPLSKESDKLRAVSMEIAN